ncbi:tape measure protein [Phascolarctobacterium sp.]|uniref:tape measure protein n=1 Tax=Phascolarctobacterium sp. TaxID=2049039 RepID=UPI002A812D77|nr:tape measure protein [Phascolarctobacterium sp.]MDY5045519.1 tape measure protein [Phascolarctobacterium sp.]
MATVADLLVRIGADTSAMKKEIAAAKRQLNTAFGKEFMDISKTAVKALEGIVVGIAAIGAASLKTATHLQTTRMAFTNLLGDAEKANEFTRKLEDFAFNTPIDFSQVTALSKEMVSLGFTTDQVIPILQAAGDAAFGLGLGAEGVNKVTDAFKMMVATGEVSTKVLKSLAMQGIPAWEMLAAKLGTDVPGAMQMVSDKAVDVSTAMQALVEGMNDKFGGQMEEYGKTLEGGLSSLQDGVERAMRQVGIRIEKALGVGQIMADAGCALGEFANAVESSGIMAALDQTIPTKFKLAIIGIATALTALAVPAIYASYLAMAPLIATLGAAVVACSPFIAAGAAIAATLASLILYWDEVVDAVSAGAQALGVLATGAAEVVTEAFFWLGKGVINAVGWMFETITGYCPDWLNEWNSMLDSAIDTGRNWAKEAIQWFQEVLSVKREASSDMDNSDSWDKTSYGFMQNDIPQKGSLFDNFKGLNNDKGGSSKGGAAKQTPEEKALDAYIKKLVDTKYHADELWKKQSQGAALHASQLSLLGDKYIANQAVYSAGLADIQNEHKNYLAGLEKEKTLSLQINDPAMQATALKSIEDRIAAEDRLYQLKLKQAQLDLNKKNVDQATTDINNNYVNQNDDVYGQMAQRENNSFNNNIQQLKEQAEAGVITLDQYKQKYTELQTEHDKFQSKLDKSKNISNQMASAFTNAFMSFLDGTKTAGEAFADFAKSIIMYIIQMIVQAAILKAIAPWMNSMFGLSDGGAVTLADGGVVYAATGGRISGAGTSRSDSIPAMLSNGEYVVNAAAVDKVGLPFLDMINRGKYPKFASGGAVSGGIVKKAIVPKAEKEPTSKTTNNSLTLSVQALDAASFNEFLGNGGLDTIKQRLFDEDRLFASEVGVW